MGKYDDIIDRKRPISKRHTPMPLENRAAQFMPFAALTGYEEALEEARKAYESDETGKIISDNTQDYEYL